MSNERKLLDIPVEQIDPDPAQPRTTFDEVELAALAESIRAHGVLQPVEVEATGDGRYRLHHGERRRRASQLAGRETIPAIVAPPRAADVALVRGLIENLHRKDLNVIEEAQVYKRLLDAGWTQTRIARETGKSLTHIASRLNWLTMEPEIQRLVALGHLPLDGRVVAALRVLPPEVRVPLAEKLVARGVATVKGITAAAERTAAEILAQAEAREQGKARHAAAAAAVPGPNVRAASHPVPMVRTAIPYANGRGPAPVATVEQAAAAMCRSCTFVPKGGVIPSWTMLARTAEETCAECERRDGPALPQVCARCPGVALLRRFVNAAPVEPEPEGDDHE